MTDLLSELRRSADRRDRELADLLAPLAGPTDSGLRTAPRASEALAAFLSAHLVAAPAAPAPDRALPSAAPDLVVVIGPTKVRTTRASLVRAAVRAVLPTAAWAQAVLVAAAASAAVGAGVLAVGGTAGDPPRPANHVAVSTTADVPPPPREEPTPRARRVDRAATPAAPGRQQVRSVDAGAQPAAERTEVSSRRDAPAADQQRRTPDPPAAAVASDEPGGTDSEDGGTDYEDGGPADGRGAPEQDGSSGDGSAD